MPEDVEDLRDLAEDALETYGKEVSMSSTERAQQLRDLADQLEAVGTAEDALADAVEAYRDDPSDKNKAAYRDASYALVDARQKVRSPDTPRAVAPGDISITPGTVGGIPGVSPDEFEEN